MVIDSAMGTIPIKYEKLQQNLQFSGNFCHVCVIYNVLSPYQPVLTRISLNKRSYQYRNSHYKDKTV